MNWETAFSLTWPVSMQIYCNKRERFHKKRVQLPEDWFGTPTWSPYYCFGKPIWPPWRHVETLYSLQDVGNGKVHSTTLVEREKKRLFNSSGNVWQQKSWSRYSIVVRVTKLVSSDTFRTLTSTVLLKRSYITLDIGCSQYKLI